MFAQNVLLKNKSVSAGPGNLIVKLFTRAGSCTQSVLTNQWYHLINCGCAIGFIVVDEFERHKTIIYSRIAVTL